MIDDAQIKTEATPERPPVDRLWLVALLVIGGGLFLVGPTAGDSAALDQASLLESASLADAWMEGGFERAQESAGHDAPLGFLTRWATSVILLLNPTGDDFAWARGVACIIWVFSWWGLTRFIAGRRVRLSEPLPWMVLCILLLIHPSRAAACGELTGAWMLGSGVIFALACRHLVLGPQTTWSIGVLWGLLTLIHPALVTLGIPIFVFAAQTYKSEEPQNNVHPGHALLPPVPLSLLASPAVAAVVVLGLWSLTGGTTRELGASIDHLWRHASPGLQGASPGMAVWAGFSSLGWAPTALAILGSLLPGIDRACKIAWFVLATILVSGGLDGRLTQGTANLMLFSTPFLTALAIRVPEFFWRRARP